MARRRTSIGRQRIAIRRIEREAARQVCFSKRRTGLFKKCSEVAIMCGVELAAVVISPGRKPFTFGHPSVEAVLERFAPTGAAAGAGGGGGDGGELAELSRQSRELRVQLDAAEKALKERAEAATTKQRAAASPIAVWLDANVRDLGEAELMAFEAALAGVQVAVARRANKEVQDVLNYGSANNNQVQPMPQMFLPYNGGGYDQFGAGSSSSSANNGMTEMQIHMQKMMMLMTVPPQPGFAGTGLEMTMMEQGLGFPGPY